MAYAPKIAACCLIPSTYPQLPDNKQTELRKIFKSLALEEASPLMSMDDSGEEDCTVYI